MVNLSGLAEPNVNNPVSDWTVVDIDNCLKGNPHDGVILEDWEYSFLQSNNYQLLI